MTVREDMQAGDSGLAAWARAISVEHNDDHDTIASGRLSETGLSATYGTALLANASVFGNGTTDAKTHLATYAAEAAARGIPLVLPGGAWRTTGDIDLPDNATVYFESGAYIKPDTGTYANGVFRALGSEGTRSTLESNVTAGSYTVTLPSAFAATLALGDIIAFDSTAIQYSTDVRSRELHKVVSVSGSSVTLDGPMRYAYLTADTARVSKVTPVRNVTIRDARFYSSAPGSVSNARTMLISYGVNCHVFNTTIESGTGPIQMSDCIDSTVQGVTVDRMPNISSFLGYAVVFSGGSYNWAVTGIRGRYCRHAFTTLGKVYDGYTWGGPRNGRISDSIIQMGDTTFSGFDTHPEGEDIDFVDCWAYGGSSNTANGFQVRAKRVRLINCKAIGCGGRGVRVDSATAVDCVIDGGEYAYNGLEGIGGGKALVRSADIHHNSGPGINNSGGSLDAHYNKIWDNGGYGYQDQTPDSTSSTIIGNYIPYSATQTLSVLSPKNNAIITFNTLPGYPGGGDGVGGTISAGTRREPNFTDSGATSPARVNINAPDVAQQVAMDTYFGTTLVERLRRGAAGTTLVRDLRALTQQVINGTLQFTSGGLLRLDATWSAPIRTANGYLWQASGGVWWTKAGSTAPTSETDGVVIGTQT